MLQRHERVTLLLGIFLALPALASAQEVPVGVGAKAEKSANSVVYKVNWADTKTGQTYKQRERIGKATQVAVRVTAFNYLRYTPVAKVDAVEIPVYQSLEKLWGMFLALPKAGPMVTPPGAAAPSFGARMLKWRTAIDEQDDQLREFLANAPKSVGLGQAEMTTISNQADARRKALESLETLRADAYRNVYADGEASPEMYYRQVLYSAELERHKAVVEKLQTFVALAGDVINGHPLPLAGQKPGTRVTVTLTPRPNGEDKEIVDTALNEGASTLQYFVQSDMPVAFHAGPAFTYIEDVDFEKVQAAAGDDLFRKLEKPDAAGDLVAFLSYELATSADGQRGIYFSFGTGVRSPGERLFAGITGRLTESLFVTAGAFTKEVDEGVNFVTGDLAESVKRVHKIGGFGALTFSPF
jgi:hypothetical protein